MIENKLGITDSAQLMRENEKELLDKFYCDKDELASLYAYKSKPLGELAPVADFIKKEYGADILTIYRNGSRFSVYPYNKIIPYVGGIMENRATELEKQIALCLPELDKDSIFCDIALSFSCRAVWYLCLNEGREEIKRFFSDNFGCEIELPDKDGIIYVCVFDRYEDAWSFTHGEKLEKAKTAIFEILQKYDSYNILERDHIAIMARARE